MRVWCFEGSGGLWALTSDEAGGNLPIEHSPWRAHKAIDLTGNGADEEEAEQLIREHGFCCFEPD